jgi:hypothetical protein
MTTILNPDLIRDAVEYFTEFRKGVSRKTILNKNSEAETEYREHLAVADIAARHLGQFDKSDLEVISAASFLVDDVVSGDAQDRVWLHSYLSGQPNVIEYQVQLKSVNAAINVLTGYEQVMDTLKIWE